MIAIASTLLVASSIAPGLAPQPVAQEPDRGAPRYPVDVSLGGAPSVAIGLAARPAVDLDCRPRIADQATGDCLVASSIPTHGALFPYPGVGNGFVPPAFVGGGEDNAASAPWSTVAGGQGNTASEDGATVAGGQRNAASGRHTTIGGGISNRASANYATVGGGYRNTAGIDFATVGGGISNVASGYYSTVPGGILNAARGSTSFAAGRFAEANHPGSFVWGDGIFSDIKTSSMPHEFNVYCSGGARFFSNRFASTGVSLAPGGGSWSSVSDRDSKENVEPVDARRVLERLAALPLSTWNYKTQDDAIRHMGPMAQDFRAAFGLGASERLIDTIDADGVALAAIQGLNAELESRLAEKDAEIERLRASHEGLRRELGAVRAALGELTERLEGLEPRR